jgi:hypothetical protein
MTWCRQEGELVHAMYMVACKSRTMMTTKQHKALDVKAGVSHLHQGMCSRI